MKTSEKGIELLKNFEGFRSHAYKALSNEPYFTIGWGHYGADVKENDFWNQKHADRQLKKDLVKFENLVIAYDYHYHWTQNEFDALVSFTYNCGGSNLKNLLAWGKRTKNEIAYFLPQYNKANGKTIPGLVTRRTAELELFLGSVTKPPNNGSRKTFEIEKARFHDEEFDTVFYTDCACHIRVGAGIKKQPIKILDSNTRCKCYGYYSTIEFSINGNTKWLLVVADGVEGFVSENCLG